MAQTSLQSTQTKVPTIGVSVPAVTGNPETIVNALGKFPNKAARDLALDAATNGFLPAYHAPGCSGTTSGRSLSISGALAQQGLIAATKEGLGAIPVVGGALKGLASLVTLPFAKHKQAVAKEQANLCDLVPAANQLLQGIDELLLTGQIDGATAAQALEQGYANWRAAAKPILKDTGGKCNAACVYEKAFRAAIEIRKLRIASGGVLDARGSNDVNVPAPPPPIPAGSTGGLVPARTGWNTPAAAGAQVSPFQSASILSLAGFTPTSQSKLAVAVLVFVVLVFAVSVNLATRRGK